MIMTRENQPPAEVRINSLEELIAQVRKAFDDWSTKTMPWFRGEPNGVKTPLLPKVYRTTDDGRSHNENRLLQQFRMKAPSLGIQNTPPRGHTDEWIFLAQHVGLPTRLLDWTEGLFIALYFALLEKEPAIWMLDPIELNRKSLGDEIGDTSFPLTWYDPGKTPLGQADLWAQTDLLLSENKENVQKDVKEKVNQLSKPNIGNINIRGAWELDSVGINLPVAIHPTNIHPRMSAQKSCFSIQGRSKKCLNELVGAEVLRKFVIPGETAQAIKNDLRIMGITHTSAFPDLDNLAKDLADWF